MKINRQNATTRFRIAAALLAGAFVMPNHTWAQQIAQVKPPVPAASTPQAAGEETPVSKKPGGDGIKIHGHWVIDIKNPDGTVAKHLDFENSLTTGAGDGTYQGITGDQVLAALLSGTVSASDPGIALIQAPAPGNSIPAGTDPTSLCILTKHPAGYVCAMMTTANSLNQTWAGIAEFIQTGLTSQVHFSTPVSWVISGNYTVPSGFTSLSIVQTQVPVCLTNKSFYTATYSGNFVGTGAGGSSTVTATNCTESAFHAGGVIPVPVFGPLTQTLVPGAPIAVSTNQILTITVTITFS